MPNPKNIPHKQEELGDRLSEESRCEGWWDCMVDWVAEHTNFERDSGEITTGLGENNNVWDKKQGTRPNPDDTDAYPNDTD